MDHFTDNLKHYPIPSGLAAKLRQDDAVAQQHARQGDAVPASIALAPSDFATVDTVVRACSDGRFTARTVHWNGRGLRAA